MRYKFSEKVSPKVDDERVVEKFLLFPKVINEEIRWLETTKILQKYITYEDIKFTTIGITYTEDVFVWKDIRFVDDL
ncbi:MAG TPA: hypothetical protein PLH46_06365 [Caldisericia bacterium]|nr:hypothetical protein [Caldisericia bacterium]